MAELRRTSLLIVLTMLLREPLWAAKKTPNVKTSIQIKRELDRNDLKIKSIRKEINSFKFRLEKTNRRYSQLSKKRKVIEDNIASQKKQLREIVGEIDKKMTYINKLMRSVVVNSFDKEEYDIGYMASNKVLVTKLRKELAITKKLKSRNFALSKEVSRLLRRYNEHIDIEHSLIQLIRDWELNKRDKSSTYLSFKKRSKSLKKEYRMLTTPKKKTPVLKERFSIPVDKYVRLEHGKKGITYKVKGKGAVRSSRSGKVVYSGRLSTFGNVIMIDHGKDLRSIILGQFKPHLRRGTVVSKGDILGYTSGEKNGKIYFEVRKNNIAQNTILLMDKS